VVIIDGIVVQPAPQGETPTTTSGGGIRFRGKRITTTISIVNDKPAA
jgi:hypothetical protein